MQISETLPRGAGSPVPPASPPHLRMRQMLSETGFEESLDRLEPSSQSASARTSVSVTCVEGRRLHIGEQIDAEIAERRAAHIAALKPFQDAMKLGCDVRCHGAHRRLA